MSEHPTPYQKHQSFVEIRQRKALHDILPRIQTLADHLDKSRLDDKAKAIVRQACTEILKGSESDDLKEAFKLYPNVIEEVDRLTDAELPQYMWYRFRYEIFPQRKLLDHFPPLLQIEPTSICNYRCIFCYQTDMEFTDKAKGQMGSMSLDLFKKLIDQTQGNAEAVTLASRGEPLICRDIEGMLAYIRGKFLALKMNTNASLLDEKKCHAILQAGIQTLVISADAAAEPAYSQFRVNGKLDRVVANVKMLRDIRLKQYPQSRMITRVSGVQVPGTPNLDEMEAFWGELVDQVAFVKYNPWEDTYLQPINDIQDACSDLWRRMFVWWDGTVNPCDVDYKSALKVGTATEKPLTDLWQSESYQTLRQKHLARQRSSCDPCQRCTVI